MAWNCSLHVVDLVLEEKRKLLLEIELLTRKEQVVNTPRPG